MGGINAQHTQAGITVVELKFAKKQAGLQLAPIGTALVVQAVIGCGFCCRRQAGGLLVRLLLGCCLVAAGRCGCNTARIAGQQPRIGQRGVELAWRCKGGKRKKRKAYDRKRRQPCFRQSADGPSQGPDRVRCYKRILPGIHILPSIFNVRTLHYDRFCHLARCAATFLLTYQFILI